MRPEDQMNQPVVDSPTQLILPSDAAKWYALYTRARFEKKVDFQLKEKGIESYLPLRTVVRQWSDRKQKVEEPLFKSYIFVHVPPADRILALQTFGVVRMVNFKGVPAVIPDEQIEAVKRVLQEIETVELIDYLTIGQMVEVINGPLIGLRGILIEKRGRNRLVITIDQIKQALSVEIRVENVQAVKF